MTFAKPQQNLALPYAVQKRVDSMFAGSTGLSGPEMLLYFSRLDPSIEQYSWSGGMPSRKQILQDCLARFPKVQQMEIMSDILLNPTLDPAEISAERDVISQENENIRDALLASLSHDLRTPLAAITGSVTTLQQMGATLPKA